MTSDHEKSATMPVLATWLREKTAAAAVSGLGGFVAVYLLAQVTQSLGGLLLIAPFGASCVLLFALPKSPLAQPRNVIGGHLISTFVGLTVLTLLGSHPLAMGLGVGLAIMAMQITGTLHPPAGGDPLVVIAAGAGWSFLAMPVLFGTVALVAVAFGYHRLVSREPYASSLWQTSVRAVDTK